MVWNPAFDRIGTAPARGRRRTGNLVAFLLVCMFLLANVLADTIAILPSPLLGRWLFLALEIAAALALITAVHTTRVGDQARWSRSFVRALEPLGFAHFGALMLAYGAFAVFVNQGNPGYLFLAAVGLLVTIGCLAWTVRAIRQPGAAA